MPACYFLIGPPGCGKSTWCQTNLARLHDPVVISSDARMEELARLQGRSYDEMFKLVDFAKVVRGLRIDFARATLRDRDIVIDRTNCTVADRMIFLRLVPQRYERIGVVFEFDKQVLRDRVVSREKNTGKKVPLFVIDHKINELVRPLPGEFDRIEVVSLAHP